VPNGGIQVRTDSFNFEAPETGYHDHEEISMAADTPRWSPQGSGDYFVKLNTNVYARVTLQVLTNGDRFITVVSYLNPEPGSRNLEFDPKKQVRRSNCGAVTDHRTMGLLDYRTMGLAA